MVEQESSKKFPFVFIEIIKFNVICFYITIGISRRKLAFKSTRPRAIKVDCATFILFQSH